MDKDREGSAKVIVQEIGEVHAAERGSISLTRLPEEFYERATTYLRTLLAKIENSKSSTDQVVSEQYYRSSEEYRRSREILTNIYNTRERKIVLMAMNSARKIQQSTENMVHDEMDLFFSLKFELEKIRDRIIKVGAEKQSEPIRGETGINTPITDYQTIEKTPSPKKGQDLKKERTGPKKDDSPPHPNEEPGEQVPDTPQGKVLVKAVKDIAAFMCPDETTMSMKKDDVALLEEEIAKLLVTGGFVERMEVSS